MCSLTDSSSAPSRPPLPSLMPEEKRRKKNKDPETSRGAASQPQKQLSEERHHKKEEEDNPKALLSVLADEFSEIREGDKDRVERENSVKLYLTDSELVVATRNKEGQLRHLRTHSLQENKLIQGESQGKLVLTVEEEEEGIVPVRFKYRKTSDHNREEWRERISSNITSSLPPLPILSSLSPPPAPPTVRIQRPSREWHGETLCTENSRLSSLFVPSKNRIKSSSLRRREAFRPKDLKRFSLGSRSSSVPPPEEEREEKEEEKEDEGISHLNQKLIISSPSRHSSLKKKKLISFSPKNIKFTRAFSAKVMNASHSAQSSPKPSKKEIKFKRGHSFHSEFSTASLPRSLPNKYVIRSRSVYRSPDSHLKSPMSSNLFKVFQRKRIHSVTNELDRVDGMGGGDLFSRPNHLKLYLQNPKLVAEELSLIDSEMFRKINLSELVNNAWMKKSKHSTSPNVLAMIQTFNRIACIVCTEIVHERCLQTRGKAISKYITLAGRCYRLHNYNSMKAIISGLECQAVYRLKRSWNHVPSRKRKKYRKLSELCSGINSDDIQKEMETNLQNRVQCIPYLGWLLTSIVHCTDYKSLRVRSESFSEDKANKKWSKGTSICAVSMPTSPINEDDNSSLEKSEAISRSLGDITEDKQRNNITHPLFLSLSPPPPQVLQVKAPTTSTSDSESSMKADSAIGLDSSMSQASPERKPENIKEQEKEEEEDDDDEEGEQEGGEDYSLPVLERSFEDSETEDDIHVASISIISSSCSSSNLSLTSPFTPLPSTLGDRKRRVTLPTHPLVSPPSRLEVCIHSHSSGVLFSSCPVRSHSSYYDLNELTTYRLSAVARQLDLMHSEDGSDKDDCVTTDAASNEVEAVAQIPVRKDSMMILFEQYQVNTLSCLTDYSGNAKLRQLIFDIPCIDDRVCHAVSLQVEP